MPAIRARRVLLPLARCLLSVTPVLPLAALPVPENHLAPPPPPGASAADLLDLPIEQLMSLPVESVSGVSKYEQAIRRAPAGVTVFTAADIRNYGWRTLADALRAAPGFHIRHDRFYEYVGNRGFTRPYDYNSRTLVLVNGHRLNDPIYQQGPVGTDFILDLDIVERIEIIRGPGSSVYGSNAFYGAINVIPKRGRDFAGAEAALAIGTEPSGKARVSVGDRSAGGVEYTLSATAWASEGERSFDLPATWRAAHPSFVATEARDRDDLSVANAFGHVAWRGLEAEVAYGRRNKDVLPPVYFTNIDTPAYAIDERAYALVRATGEPGPDSQITAALSLDYYHYEGRFAPADTFHLFAPYADSVSLNTEIRWRQTIADRHTLLAGIEAQSNLRQDIGRNNLTTGAADVRVRETTRYYSPFAQLDWEISEPLRVSLGGRYDVYDYDQQRFTPRFGLIWDVTSATTLKFLYGESFRVPNVSERNAAELNFVVNPDLGPELNRTWEIIAEHRLNSVWNLQAQAYHVISSDLIGTVELTPPPAATYTYANAQKIITQGVDLGATAHFPTGVQLRASGTLQRAYDDATGRIVADAPRTLLKLAASTPLGPRWLRGSVEFQYVGDRDDALGQSVGDYATANLTLRASQLWHGWDLALSVYNVANTRWSEPTDSGQIDAVPRTAVFRATYEF